MEPFRERFGLCESFSASQGPGPPDTRNSSYTTQVSGEIRPTAASERAPRALKNWLGEKVGICQGSIMFLWHFQRRTRDRRQRLVAACMCRHLEVINCECRRRFWNEGSPTSVFCVGLSSSIIFRAPHHLLNPDAPNSPPLPTFSGSCALQGFSGRVLFFLRCDSKGEERIGWKIAESCGAAK